MTCLFEVYSLYFDAAERAHPHAMDALWDEVAGLKPLESMAGAQALEDWQMQLPRSGQVHFCRMHQARKLVCPRLARPSATCA